MSKALIIHHDDQDGRMGGYIMKKYYEGQDLEVKTLEANYNTSFDFGKLLEAGDKCCIVDYSLSNRDLSALINVIDSKDIVWIDHHKSAIEKFAKSDLADKIGLEGLRFVGLSGCELAWIYSKGYREKTPGKMVNIDRDAGDLDFIDIYDIELPKAVGLIGDFDCWRQQFKDSYNFAMGLSSVWDKCLLTIDWGCKFWDSILSNKDNIIDIFIARGKIVADYLQAQNKAHVLDRAFPCHLRKFADLKAIALNTDAKNSKIFDSVKDKYEIGLVFYFTFKNNAAKMSFSIYRLGLNPSKKIDVAKIAETFGGGGHEGAAGFSTPGSLPFIDLPSRYPKE